MPRKRIEITSKSNPNTGYASPRVLSHNTSECPDDIATTPILRPIKTIVTPLSHNRKPTPLKLKEKESSCFSVVVVNTPNTPGDKK
jgi:hypothetical protein